MNVADWWFRYRRIVGVAMLWLLLLGAAQHFDLRQHFQLESLRQTLADSRWEGLVVFILLFSLGNLLQVPGWIFLAAAVLVLGRLAGGVVTYLAACVSCAVTFLSVRWVGHGALQQLHGALAQRLLRQLQTHPIRNVVVLRTLFQTLAVLNYSLAMSGIGFRQYMAATLMGLPVPIAAYCIFFDYVERIAHLAP